MEVEWHHLPSEFRHRFSFGVLSLWRKIERCSEEDLVNFMHNCYLLKWDWYNYRSAQDSEASFSLREEIFRLLESHYNEPSKENRSEGKKRLKSSPYTASIFYWLGMSGMQWQSDLSKATKTALVNGILSYCQSNEVSALNLNILFYG